MKKSILFIFAILMSMFIFACNNQVKENYSKESPVSEKVMLSDDLPPFPQSDNNANMRQLDAKWNLVSMPVQGPTPVLDFLNSNSSFFSNIHSIWKWDNELQKWQTFPKQGAFPELEYVTPDDGYWIKAIESFDLTGDGRTNDYTFVAGWNLIGYSHSGTEVTVEDFFSQGNFWGQTCEDGETVVSVWAWTGSNWNIYFPTESGLTDFNNLHNTNFEALTNITSGMGIWVNATRDNNPPTTDESCVIINGLVGDENNESVKDALVSIDGIEAETLTNSKGAFTVKSESDFDSEVTINVIKDGFEHYNETITLPNDDKIIELGQKITLIETDPWGYVEIKLTSNNFLVNGAVMTLSDDQIEIPVEGALVRVNGIEAKSLTDLLGAFVVKSESDFVSPVSIEVTKDGFESYTGNLEISGSEKIYQLENNIVLVESQQSELKETEFLALAHEGDETKMEYFSSAATPINRNGLNSQSCSCELTLSGRAFKKGHKDSEIYILLIVDASGSTGDKKIGDKTVFQVEIDSLTALVDRLISSDQKTNVGILRFSSEAEITHSFTNNLTEIKDALAAMSPEAIGAGGSTNYKAALDLAKDTFKGKNLKKHDVKTIAFISDGIPTSPYGSGFTQEKEDRIFAIDSAKELDKEKVIVNTYPVNINSKLTTMPSISAITGGNYYWHDADKIVDEMPHDSLVRILGIEIVNETTDEEFKDITIYPDGRYEAEICLTNNQKNILKITPEVCETCEKLSYQKVNASCQGEKCSKCEGQVTMLELKYTGDIVDAVISIEQPGKKAKDGDIVIYEDTIQPNDSFEFFGGWKDKTMGSEITVYVNGVENTKFKTSCGVEKIGPGLSQGDFEVIKGYSRNGGLLCKVD